MDGSSLQSPEKFHDLCAPLAERRAALIAEPDHGMRDLAIRCGFWDLVQRGTIALTLQRTITKWIGFGN